MRFESRYPLISANGCFLDSNTLDAAIKHASERMSPLELGVRRTWWFSLDLDSRGPLRLNK